MTNFHPAECDSVTRKSTSDCKFHWINNSPTKIWNNQDLLRFVKMFLSSFFFFGFQFIVTFVRFFCVN